MSDMNYRKLIKNSTLFLFFTLAALPGFSQSPGTLPSLNDILPAISSSDSSALMNDGELLRFHGNGVSPALLPNTSLTAGIARQMISGDLNIGIEGLFFTPLSELPEKYREMTPDERRLTLYNILRSVSTLQGLEYYSASRGEMRLLFEESWTIAKVKKPKVALADPLVSTIPAEDTIMIHQKDKSFNNNESSMTFRARSNAFAADIINLTPMRYKGFIRIADPGDMQIHLIVVPVEEGLLMYGTMSAKTLNVKAFLERAQNSFTTRVIALTGWYRARLGEEFSD
ncbi:MAG TPA: hypothetical protein DCO79_11375 [Spirochaeta sp.]|nr:hypothetical protein [Spirochaeta sp.]